MKLKEQCSTNEYLISQSGCKRQKERFLHLSRQEIQELLRHRLLIGQVTSSGTRHSNVIFLSVWSSPYDHPILSLRAET